MSSAPRRHGPHRSGRQRPHRARAAGHGNHRARTTALDLGVRDAVLASLRHAGCDAIVNAAAYTQVDKAESEPERAMLVNGVGAGNVAEAAAELCAPLLHLSTDYVFDGALDRPYREDDPTCPSTAYGRSKLAGEEQIAARHQNHPDSAHRLGLQSVRRQFRQDHAAPRRRARRSSASSPINGAIRPMRSTSPTRFSRWRDASSPNSSPNLRGVFHLAGSGEATWADVAEQTFAVAERLGRKPVRVKRIATADYPTPARRPANSRLDTAKLRENLRSVDAALARLRLKIAWSV